MQFELEGQFEARLRWEISIREHEHAVEGRRARERLREVERLFEIARHVLDFERGECVAQLGPVVREAGELARGFGKRDEAEFLIRGQSFDAFAQPLLRLIEPRAPAILVERAHARRDIHEHRQPRRALRIPPEKWLHRREREQREQENLEQQEQVAFEFLKRRIHPLIAEHLPPQHERRNDLPRALQLQKIEDDQRHEQCEKPRAGEGGEGHGASAKTGVKPACLK